MSMPNKATVNCPDCNAAFTTTVWSSVNTDLSEDLAEKIISGCSGGFYYAGNTGTGMDI